MPSCGERPWPLFALEGFAYAMSGLFGERAIRTYLACLLLLRVERKQVRYLLFQVLPLALETGDFLRHGIHFSRELLLELLNVNWPKMSTTTDFEELGTHFAR